MRGVSRDDDDGGVNDDDNENTQNELRTRTTGDHHHPHMTMWLPMHAGNRPTTTHRRPHAVGPHVEGPVQARTGPGGLSVLFRAACRGHGRRHGSPLDGVSLDLGRSAKVAQGEHTDGLVGYREAK